MPEQAVTPAVITLDPIQKSSVFSDVTLQIFNRYYAEALTRGLLPKRAEIEAAIKTSEEINGVVRETIQKRSA
jgi:hypothetical protein